MRVGLLAGMLGLALGSGVVAQSPTPEAVEQLVTLDGGRVAMPEVGFAVAFPDGWTVTEFRSEARPQDKMMATGDGTCFVSEWWTPSDPPPFDSVDIWVSAYVDWASDDVPDYEASGVMLDLDVGRVGRIDLARIESSPMGVTHGTKYLYSDGQRWFVLDCMTKTSPPDDRWLSIAETFEFLAQGN